MYGTLNVTGKAYIGDGDARWNEKNLDDKFKYYSKMKPEELMNFVILPLAQDITYRSYQSIGKIKSFFQKKDQIREK